MRKENPFEIVCRFERRANFLRSFLGLIITHCIEKGGERGRETRSPPPAQLQWGIYLYFFVHPLLSFSVFFLVFGEQLFAYLRGRSTCYPQFVLSGSQRPLPKCSLGLLSVPQGISIHRVRNGNGNGDCLGECEKSVQNAIKYAEHLHLAFNKTNTK